MHVDCRNSRALCLVATGALILPLKMMSSKECVVDLKYMYIVQTEFFSVSQTSTFNLSLFVLPSSAFICSMTWKAKFCYNYDN